MQTQLPDYMVPAQVIRMDTFPLLGNGKTDYKALENNVAESDVMLPENDIERKIMAIWKEILGDKPISTEDSFQSVGGNSLSIMRLIGYIYKEFNVRISLNELFNNLTVKKQALLLQNAVQDDVFTIKPAEDKQEYVLSSAQERMFYNYELNKSDTAYNLPMAWYLSNSVDIERIEYAIKGLVARHESLRTAFYYKDGRIVQVIEEEVDIELERIMVPESDVDKAIKEFVKPFDLEKASLARFGILEITPEEKLLIMDIHHIVCDGMSQINLLSDFFKLYNKQELQPLKIQYKDYAVWEAGFKLTDAYIASREFWLKKFEGQIPALELPVKTVAEHLPGKGGKVAFQVDKTVLIPVLEEFRQQEVTTFTLMLATYFMCLSKITGQEDLVVGCSTSGRIQHEVEDVVGMFVKTLPIRYRLDLDLTFKDYILQMHDLVVKANDKQMYDLSDIVKDVSQGKNHPLQGLFQTMLVYQNFENHKTFATDDFTRYEITEGAPKYPLTLYATEGDTRFDFRLEYSSAYFTATDADLLIQQFKDLVYNIPDHTDQSLARLMTGRTQVSEVQEDIEFNF